MSEERSGITYSQKEDEEEDNVRERGEKGGRGAREGEGGRGAREGEGRGRERGGREGEGRREGETENVGHFSQKIS